MSKMASALRTEGYTVHNKTYPSGKYVIKKLAEQHIPAAVEFCRKEGNKKIHFVTHSLGGILLRQYLANNTLEEAGRVVMLSPPNQGSEVAEVLKKSKFFRFAIGPALSELGTGPESAPLNLPALEQETGIITGCRTSDPWFKWVFPGPNDGKVSVERARLAGMKGFLVVRLGHTFIMNSPEVIRQTIFFLKNGRFIRQEK